jgi:hypothetical protein
VANSPPTKDCTAAMGYCMAIDHDTRVGMSPQGPPQDGRWAIFVPASYKNMTSGEAQLLAEGNAITFLISRTTPRGFFAILTTHRSQEKPF